MPIDFLQRFKIQQGIDKFLDELPLLLAKIAVLRYQYHSNRSLDKS